MKSHGVTKFHLWEFAQSIRILGMQNYVASRAVESNADFRHRILAVFL